MRTVLRHYRRACPEPRMKTDNGENGAGWIEGYLAVFGNVDRGGERIVKGAFEKSASERVKSGKVPLMAKHFAHGGDVADVIGTVTQAKEDEYGLWIHADFSSIQLAQDIRTKINEGSISGLSVGFELIRYEEERLDGKTTILNLLECRLSEATITVKPMNEQAVITAAKDLQSQLPADSTSPIDEPLSPESINALRDSVDGLLDVLCAKDDSRQEQAPQAPSPEDGHLHAMEMVLEHSKAVIEVEQLQQEDN